MERYAFVDQNDSREEIIYGLEINRSHGAFESHPEDEVNFHELSDDELDF